MFGSGGRTRRLVLVLVLVTVPALVAVAVLGWNLHDTDEGKGGAGVMAAPPSASPLSSPRAAELSALLTGGREADLRKALVLPSGQPLDPHLAGQLKSLGPISFDLTTFTYLDGRSAEVEGTVARALPAEDSSTRWIFTLLYADSQWLLVDGRRKA